MKNPKEKVIGTGRFGIGSDDLLSSVRSCRLDVVQGMLVVRLMASSRPGRGYDNAMRKQVSDVRN